MSTLLKTGLLMLMICLISPSAWAEQHSNSELSIEISIISEHERPDDIVNRIKLPDFQLIKAEQSNSKKGQTSLLTGPSSAIKGAIIAMEAKEAALSKRTEALLKHVPDIKVDVDIPIIDIPQLPDNSPFDTDP